MAQPDDGRIMWRAQIIAAAVGFAAVLFAAVGAHLVTNDIARDWIETGSRIALPHAVAALWVAERMPGVALFFACGAGLFSGALYLLALDLVPWWVVYAAPAGGVLMLTGWAALFFRLLRDGRRG